MAIAILEGNGGNAYGSDDCTATADQLLNGYTGIVNGSNDEPVNGNIQTKTNSGLLRLYPENISVNYDAGYYPNSHGAWISCKTKTVTPSTSEQIVTPDDMQVLKQVTVEAIPNQTAGADVKLTSSTTSSTKNAGIWLTSRHRVYVDVFSWG